MTDLYVQVEVGFPRSKLVDKARQQLGLTTDVAIAKFVRLWLAVMATNCHGQIGERSDSWIEEEVGWTGPVGAFAAFVRLHHLDSTGIIYEWPDKYGAVETGRTKARTKKRNQRAKLRLVSSGQTEGPNEGLTEGPYRDVPETLLQSPISGLKMLATGNTKSEDDELATRRAEAMVSLSLFMARHDFGRFRDQVEGFIRATQKPVNVMAHLELWLTGEMGYKQKTGEQVGFAVNQYAASGERDFKAAFFDGFVRRVKAQVDRNTGAEHRAQEDATLAEEKRAAELREQESRDGHMLADFERQNEAKFEELKAKALAKTKTLGRMTAATREIIAHDELIRLVRAEVG